MRRLSTLIAVVGLAACQPGAGPGYTDDPHEGYVDPGPDQVALGIERGAATAVDAAGQAVALRTARIWEDRDEDHWLYIEEGAEPVRRYVAHVAFASSGYPMTVYRLPASALPPDSTAEDPLTDLSVDQLELASECTLTFDRTGPGDYAGQTGTDCASPRSDTAYETLEVILDDAGVQWSRRGFDADSAQVWGPPPTPAR